jgi:hypothetical protein
MLFYNKVFPGIKVRCCFFEGHPLKHHAIHLSEDRPYQYEDAKNR